MTTGFGTGFCEAVQNAVASRPGDATAQLLLRGGMGVGLIKPETLNMVDDCCVCFVFSGRRGSWGAEGECAEDERNPCSS